MLKNKLVSALGGAGFIVWLLISVLISVFPIVAIHPHWIISILLCFAIVIIRPLIGPLWIWGLVCTIIGKQDTFAIIYYVLTAVLFLPHFISILLSFGKKNR